MRAGPLLFFFTKMLSGSNSFDTHGIVNQADQISLPITFIEPLDGRAGKSRALKTKIKPLTDCTVFDLAFPAMVRFAGILAAAPQAGFLFFQMHITDRTGNPAGRQHGREYIGVHLHDWVTMFPYLSRASYCFRYFISFSFAISLCTLVSSPVSPSFPYNNIID